MPIVDYNSLVAKAQMFLKRQDLSGMLPDFIQFAEDYFDKNVYVNARRAQFIWTPQSGVFASPSDMKQPIQAYYMGRLLDFFPIGFESSYAGGNGNKLAFGYQLVGDNISLSVPQFGQVFTLDYYKTLEPLSPSNPSNWLLEDAPTVYLAGVLFEAFAYIRDYEKSAYWMQKRDATMQDYIDDDTASRHPQGPLTIRAG